MRNFQIALVCKLDCVFGEVDIFGECYNVNAGFCKDMNWFWHVVKRIQGLIVGIGEIVECGMRDLFGLVGNCSGGQICVFCLG